MFNILITKFSVQFFTFIIFKDQEIISFSYTIGSDKILFYFDLE